MSVGDYCRAVEAYLCRKNDGHLIRIVGPAFEMVRGWEAAGIPPSAVERGIDRTYRRYYAKGPKRRPVRIEFCEADVLDVFDEWRRAVGIRDDGATSGEGERTTRRRRSLADHLTEVVARLSTFVDQNAETLTGPAGRALAQRAAEMAATVDALRPAAATLRGTARTQVIGQLQAFEDEIRDGARAAADPTVRARLRDEATASLEPFRTRMSSDDFARAVEAAADRLLVEQLRLPPLAYD